jgi:general secretion pathway protein C
VYSVGQNLPGGAKLHAVYDDRVILDRNGALESLMLPHGAGGRGAAPPPVVANAAAPGENPLLDKMRRLITSDPGVVGEILRPQPVFTDGKMNGYRVYPGRNRAAFSHLGLQAGDLVTSINGTPLDDPNRGNEIFRTLSTSSEARVSVMRNGRQQDLVLNLSQVANEAQQTLGAAATGSAAAGNTGAAASVADGSGSDAPAAANPAGAFAVASPSAAATAPNAAPAPASPALPPAPGPAE